jgi:hypothetical protein
MGNISHLVPSIHPMLAIAPDDISLHSLEFTSAAASGEGSRAIADGAGAMALTIVDLLSDPAKLSEVTEDYYLREKRGE